MKAQNLPHRLLRLGQQPLVAHLQVGFSGQPGAGLTAGPHELPPHPGGGVEVARFHARLQPGERHVASVPDNLQDLGGGKQLEQNRDLGNVVGRLVAPPPLALLARKGLKEPAHDLAERAAIREVAGPQ